MSRQIKWFPFLFVVMCPRHKKIEPSPVKRFPGGARGKERACQFRRHERCGFDPWVEKIPRRRAWQPISVFFSCLENPMDRGAWQATVHSVTKCQTWLKWLSTHCKKNYSIFTCRGGNNKCRPPLFLCLLFTRHCAKVCCYLIFIFKCILSNPYENTTRCRW